MWRTGNTDLRGLDEVLHQLYRNLPLKLQPDVIRELIRPHFAPLVLDDGSGLHARHREGLNPDRAPLTFRTVRSTTESVLSLHDVTVRFDRAAHHVADL